MNVDHLLLSVPPVLVYVLVGLAVMIESLGVPVPGEIVLVAAALLASRGSLHVSPGWVAVAGTLGAVIGDSTGFEVGRHFGRRMLGGMKRRFPSHFGAAEIAYAEHVFTRHGMWAVFFGRWVALLRIFSGPISGMLRMPYLRFFPANLLGGLTWCFVTVFGVFYLGTAAETWLKRFAWVGLVLFAVAAVALTTVLRRRVADAVERFARENPDEVRQAEAL